MERFFKSLNAVFTTLLILVAIFTQMLVVGATTPGLEGQANSNDELKLVYNTSVVNSGWQDFVEKNTNSGQPDGKDSIQALSVSLSKDLGTVKYRVYLSNSGWTEWSENGGTAGVEDNSQTVKAIQIRFSEDLSQSYDLYYQVYLDGQGWTNYTTNDMVAGSEQFDKDIKAININYAKKDEEVPVSVNKTDNSQVKTTSVEATPNINYQAHVSFIGWQNPVKDGDIAGTTGQSISLEALKINLENAGNNSWVEYTVQSQDIGWMSTNRDGQEAGTVGESRPIEAVCISLKGDISEQYDVYYRIHSAYIGWLGWAKNGDIAGTVGIRTPAEAIQIELVKKGGPAPGTTNQPNITAESLKANANVRYNSFVNGNWQNETGNGEMSGSTGACTPIEAFSVHIDDGSNTNVQYQAYVSDIGWQDPQSNGTPAGVTGQGKHIEALVMNLGGDDAGLYDLYYQVYVQDYGWLGWAKNGEMAGTVNGNKQVEAFHVLMLPRGSQAPGSTDNAFLQLEPPTWYWPLDGYGPDRISSGFGWRPGENHLGIDILAPAGTPIKASKGGTVQVAGWYYGYGICAVVQNDSGEKVYYAHMSQINTSVGAHVDRGQVIGFVGMTGQANANHLHLGVVANGNWTNPLVFF